MKLADVMHAQSQDAMFAHRTGFVLNAQAFMNFHFLSRETFAEQPFLDVSRTRKNTLFQEDFLF